MGADARGDPVRSTSAGGHNRQRSYSSKLRRSEDGKRAAAVTHHGKSLVDGYGREEVSYVSQYKRFVTFYFTNFLAQLSNFYLRKGLEVCCILEDVVVPSK